jgi:hypothetical protein
MATWASPRTPVRERVTKKNCRKAPCVAACFYGSGKKGIFPAFFVASPFSVRFCVSVFFHFGFLSCTHGAARFGRHSPLDLDYETIQKTKTEMKAAPSVPSCFYRSK